MRVVLLLVFILISIAGLTTTSSAVQCSCPSIAADGQGNSSCSATETGARCTVDFNRFPENLEQKASGLLAANAPQSNTKYTFPPEGVPFEQSQILESAELLNTAARQPSPDGFTDTLMIYLSVALASREDGPAAFDKFHSFFERLYQLVLANAPEKLMPAFRFSNDEFKPDAETPKSVSTEEIGGQDGGGLSVKFSPGCIEAREGDLWVMYKAFWSPARRLPRCGS